MRNPSVFIVVLNWNHLDDLIITMESILKQDYPNLTILISDNGSTDGSQEYIKKHYIDTILIENSENLGWAGGNNVGIRYALKNKADYILLANNDLYLENSTIIFSLVNNLISLKDKKINIIGGKVNYFHKKEKTHNIGWIMYPKSEKSGRVFNKKRNEYNAKLPDNYRIVDFVSGCFILIDRSVFDNIGLIDEAYFSYLEETDLSLRAWDAGYGSVINKDIIIYHKIAATNKVGSPFFMYLKTRNLYYLIKKHKSIIQDYKYYIAKYYYDFMKSIIKIIIYPGRFSGSQSKVLFSTIRGFFDGVIFNRKGKNGIKF